MAIRKTNMTVVLMEDEKFQLGIRAAKLGLNKSVLARALIRAYLNDEIDVPDDIILGLSALRLEEFDYDNEGPAMASSILE